MIRGGFILAWDQSKHVLLETKDRYLGHCPGVSVSTPFLKYLRFEDVDLHGAPGITPWCHPSITRGRYTISDIDAFAEWAVSVGRMEEEEQQWLLMQTTLGFASDE